MPVVTVATLTTATEVMQSLEAHAGLTMVAIIFFYQCWSQQTMAQKIFFDLGVWG